MLKVKTILESDTFGFLPNVYCTIDEDGIIDRMDDATGQIILLTLSSDWRPVVKHNDLMYGVIHSIDWLSSLQFDALISIFAEMEAREVELDCGEMFPYCLLNKYYDQARYYRRADRESEEFVQV